MATTWVIICISAKLVFQYFRQLGRKLDALKAYSSEMRPWPHARSFEALEHLARLEAHDWRAAEAFVY